MKEMEYTGKLRHSSGRHAIINVFKAVVKRRRGATFCVFKDSLVGVNVPTDSFVDLFKRHGCRYALLGEAKGRCMRRIHVYRKGGRMPLTLVFDTKVPDAGQGVVVAHLGPYKQIVPIRRYGAFMPDVDASKVDAGDIIYYPTSYPEYQLRAARVLLDTPVHAGRLLLIMSLLKEMKGLTR